MPPDRQAALAHGRPREREVGVISCEVDDDFAALLEKAIERSGRAREVKQLVAAPTQQIREYGGNQDDDRDKGGGALAGSAIASRNCAFP